MRSNFMDRAFDRYVLNTNPETNEQKRWRKARQLQEQRPGAIVMPKKDVDVAVSVIEREVDGMLDADPNDPIHLFELVTNDDGSHSIRMPRMVAGMPRNEERDREYAQRILAAYGQDNPFLARRAMRDYLEDEERDGRAYLESLTTAPTDEEQGDAEARSRD